jgi:hypothetical protein
MFITSFPRFLSAAAASPHYSLCSACNYINATIMPPKYLPFRIQHGSGTAIAIQQFTAYALCLRQNQQRQCSPTSVGFIISSLFIDCGHRQSQNKPVKILIRFWSKPIIEVATAPGPTAFRFTPFVARTGLYVSPSDKRYLCRNIQSFAQLHRVNRINEPAYTLLIAAVI